MNPFENKVWEIHIFINKCVRSLNCVNRGYTTKTIHMCSHTHTYMYSHLFICLPWSVYTQTYTRISLTLYTITSIVNSTTVWLPNTEFVILLTSSIEKSNFLQQITCSFLLMSGDTVLCAVSGDRQCLFLIYKPLKKSQPLRFLCQNDNRGETKSRKALFYIYLSYSSFYTTSNPKVVSEWNWLLISDISKKKGGRSINVNSF